ncbi:thiamine biosynthesis protein ThiS [bacterium J17]|nr:thiamine biosynthesis protein ThiS [bacterium J17]
MATVEIILNGDSVSIEGSTVAAVIEQLNLGDKKVAVELNKNIVARGEYQQTKISAGDSIEVVHFVGGG